jgi:hypothetical protein
LLSSPVAHRNLYDNQISSIESGDFTGLGNLTALSGNAMHIGIIVLKFKFRHLPSNPLTLINVGAFLGLSKLTEL